MMRKNSFDAVNFKHWKTSTLIHTFNIYANSNKMTIVQYIDIHSETVF